MSDSPTPETDAPLPPVPPPSAPPPPTPVPRRKRRLGLWISLSIAATFVLAMAVVGGVGSWAVRTEAGLRWVLSHVPGLTVTGLQGDIPSGRIAAKRLTLSISAGELVIDQPSMSGLRWRYQPHPGALAGIQLDTLRAHSVQWRSHPSGPNSTPGKPLTQLQLPVDVLIKDVQVQQVKINDATELNDVQASVALGADRGREHKFILRRLRYQHITATANLSLSANAPMNVKAVAELKGEQTERPWQAQVKLQGPLARMQAEATLSGDSASSSEPSVQAQLTTELHPFETWPVGDLRLQARALDLSALTATAPRTRLNVTALVQSAGLDQPARAQIQATNSAPGRWDAGQLPVQSLALEVSGTPQPLRELRLNALQIAWSDGKQSGGTWSGSGRYQVGDRDSVAALTLKIAQWRPALLDARMPAMQLSGPIQAQLNHLPSPTTASSVPASGKAPSTTTAATAPPAPTEPVLDLQVDLKGPLLDAPGNTPPVSLKLDSQLSMHQVLLKNVQLQAGQALAKITGELRQPKVMPRAGVDASAAPAAKGTGSALSGPWTWQLQAQLDALDPRIWWPGAAESAWRQTPQRINATLHTQGTLPAPALQQPSQALSMLRGQVELELRPSMLGGVASQGKLVADNRAGPAQVSIDLQLDDTHLSGQGKDIQSTGGHGDFALKVPRLQLFAPWMRLVPSLAGWAPSEGALQADLILEPGNGKTAAGSALPDLRWRTSGQLTQLKAGALQLQEAQWTGQGGLHPNDPVQIRLRAKEFHWQERRVTQLQAQLDGTLAEHRASVTADTSLQPPSWLAKLTNSPASAGSRVQLAMTGNWSDLGAKGSQWQSHWTQLQIGSNSSGDAALAAPGTSNTGSASGTDSKPRPWLNAPAVDLQINWAPEGPLQSVVLAPGQLQLAGVMPLVWEQARYDAPSDRSPSGHMELAAHFAPLAVAPILSKIQPDMLWRGDLRMGGTLSLRYGPRMDLDFVVERQGGDLSIDADGLVATPDRLALDMTDMRLALSAHDGVWQFTQGLAGQHLGALGGAVTVRTGADRLVPTSDATLQGGMSLQVTTLNAWASWIPAGWRLGGHVTASATVSGTLQTPHISGQMQGGDISVRNPLQGIDLTGGTLHVVADGEQIRLDELKFQSGGGTLTLDGHVTPGEHPNVQLQAHLRRFRVLNRVDRKVIVSGDATLHPGTDVPQLDAKFTIDEGTIDISQSSGPTLSDDIVLTTDEARMAQEAQAASGQRRVGLDVAVDLGRKLQLKGHGINTQLEGEIRLTNPRGPLVAKGEVRAVNGTYKAYGQNLTISRGNITFTGPVNDPRLDIYAIRPNLDVVVGVTITGSALNPRIRLASDTDLSDTQRLSWLLLGRSQDDLGQADTALLQKAAMALLAGDGEAPTDTLLHTLGLSDFSVRQDTASDGTTQETVLGVGKQISNRIYVGYERSVNAAAGTWQVVYRVAQRFTLRAQSGEENALDAVWTWRWN